MARKKLEGERYFVRLTKEQKRRLDHLTIEAESPSTEAYGGKLLGDLVDKLWDGTDAKRDSTPKAKPPKPPR